MAFTFHKSERLCSKSLIAQLFGKGNRGFSQFPFRFSWIPAGPGAPSPVQVLMIASRRQFPKASQRNRIKRQLRELYRLHKHQLYATLTGTDTHYALMIAYTGKEKMPQQELETVFRQCIVRLAHEFEKTGKLSLHPADPGV